MSIKTKTSALTLAVVLTAGAVHAQDTAATDEETQPADGGADVTVIQGDEAQPAEGEAEVVVEEAEPAEAEVVEEEAEPVEAEPVEAETVVVEEEAEPAEAEAVVIEEVEVVEEEAPEGQPVEGQIFTQSADEVLGSTFLDASVRSPDGETIGDVEDVIMSAEGQISGVVIGAGGFLGIGEKEVAVEFSQIQIVEGEAGDITFVLNATEEELEAAPEFRTRAQVEAEQAVPATATDGVAVTDPAAVPVEDEAVEGETVVVPSE